MDSERAERHLRLVMQSAVVAVMGIAGVSTTYLTGTLTTLIDSLASGPPRQGSNARRGAALGALAAGAGLSGLLLATAQAAVPAVPLARLIGAIVESGRSVRRLPSVLVITEHRGRRYWATAARPDGNAARAAGNRPCPAYPECAKRLVRESYDSFSFYLSRDF